MRRFLFWYLPVGISLIAASGVRVRLRLLSCAAIPARRSIIGSAARCPRRPRRAKLIAPIILGDSLARGAGDEAGLGIGGRLDEELRRRGFRAHAPTTSA